MRFFYDLDLWAVSIMILISGMYSRWSWSLKCFTDYPDLCKSSKNGASKADVFFFLLFVYHIARMIWHLKQVGSFLYKLMNGWQTWLHYCSRHKNCAHIGPENSSWMGRFIVEPDNHSILLIAGAMNNSFQSSVVLHQTECHTQNSTD